MFRQMCTAVLIAVVAGVLPAICQAKEIGLDERIQAQRAIEEVLWRHRTWP